MTASTRALSLLALLLAAPARGELVILQGGDVLKVDAFRVEGQRIELDLPSGGLMVLPLRRVERILDDEIVPAAERQPPPVEPPGFELLFADQPVPSVPYGELIHAAAARHGLNPQLVAAVVAAESSFRAGVVSAKGAQGLMQLMPATAERFGLEASQVFDPALNLDVGCRYLRFLTDRFAGDLPLVLAGYNAGEGAVDRHGGVPPYRETRRYIERITTTLGLD